MSEFKVQGKIKTILPVVTGDKKDGSGQWKKIEFVVTNNEGYEGAEKLFCFQIFGAEKVDSFVKHNQVGAMVNVSFDVQVNEWNGKYFTNLSAFYVQSGEAVEQATQTPSQPVPSGQPMDDDGDNSLPF